VALAVKNLSSLKRLYTAGGTGKGIADYLVALKKADLNTDVLAQFDLAIAKAAGHSRPAVIVAYCPAGGGRCRIQRNTKAAHIIKNGCSFRHRCPDHFYGQ
jgi:hypothetical protein